KDKIELSLEHLKLMDEFIEIPVVVSDFKDISGYQFSITWDANQLEYYSTEQVQLQGEFNEQYASDGILTTIWYDADGKSVDLDDGEELFILKFKVKDERISGVVDINSTLTKAIAFDGKLNALNIHGIPANVNLEELRNGSLELYQNVPNPFEQTTEISFRITKPGLAKLTVINMLGETVYIHERDYDAGVYSITWERSQSIRPVSAGVYLYRLESNGQDVVKKMLIK
ncbi:MAG: T9SS type A sorting domain-containing protein, partial [Cyclobacteriaceae bacterium]|nr:T9SS type A sorting domain-containing protein [Cyclobacteriaceae bacterium]